MIASENYKTKMLFIVVLISLLPSVMRSPGTYTYNVNTAQLNISPFQCFVGVGKIVSRWREVLLIILYVLCCQLRRVLHEMIFNKINEDIIYVD